MELLNKFINNHVLFQFCLGPKFFPNLTSTRKSIKKININKNKENKFGNYLRYHLLNKNNNTNQWTNQLGEYAVIKLLKLMNKSTKTYPKINNNILDIETNNIIYEVKTRN